MPVHTIDHNEGEIPKKFVNPSRLAVYTRWLERYNVNSKCWVERNERGMNRGTDVSRTRLLDISNRSDGVRRRHD